jgi:large subunit ribosomal protein L32
MAVPKKKISKARGGARRSHNALALPTPGSCPNCHAPKRPHHVCGACGMYDGREVIKVDS